MGTTKYFQTGYLDSFQVSNGEHLCNEQSLLSLSSALFILI